MTDHTGREVTRDTYRGRWVILYFGYSDCDDACPVALHTIAAALDRFDDGPEMPMALFAGLDHKHDTPDAMARFVEAIDNRIVGLSGTRRQIWEMARDFKVRREPGAHLAAAGGGHGGASHGREQVLNHTTHIYLLDPDGRVRDYLYHDVAPAALADRVRELQAMSADPPPDVPE